MKNFDHVIKKVNLKKIVIFYIVFTIVALLLSVALLGYVYKDKLLFAYNYSKVSEKFEDGEIEVDAVKPDITALAEQSADIVDILIIDNHNKISFSAKNSDFGDDGEFTLERKGDELNHYLTYLQNPNVTFKLMKDEELMLSTVLLDHEKQIQKSYKNNTFFEDNINAKKIFLLSYTIDKATGDKIYFISDVRPVQNGLFIIEIVSAVFILIFMLYWVFVAFWVYQDGRKSKINAMLWGSITLVTNLAGLFIYLIYKQNNQICFHCGVLQNKGNIYCIDCGTKINITCKNCNTITNEGDRFCNHCGNEINDEKGE